MEPVVQAPGFQLLARAQQVGGGRGWRCRADCCDRRGSTGTSPGSACHRRSRGTRAFQCRKLFASAPPVSHARCPNLPSLPRTPLHVLACRLGHLDGPPAHPASAGPPVSQWSSGLGLGRQPFDRSTSPLSAISVSTSLTQDQLPNLDRASTGSSHAGLTLQPLKHPWGGECRNGWPQATVTARHGATYACVPERRTVGRHQLALGA